MKNKNKPAWLLQVANRLESLYNRLPTLVKAVIWAVFFTGIAAYATLLIRDGLKGESTLPEPIISLKVPHLGPARQQPATGLSKAEYEQLLKAAKGLDSLKQICRPCYDQLMLVQPGFEDSLRHILRVYENQVKQPIQINRP